MIPESTSTAVSTSPEDNVNSNTEATSSGAVNHPEDDSGNENRQKKRRKRALKGSESVKGKSSKGSSKSGGRKGKQNHVEVVTLYEVLSMGKSAMQTVISDWIDAYMTDRDSSLLDLISFFIQCSGCKGVVTAEMCQSKVKEVEDKMVEELDEGTGVQYKKFLAFPWILTVTWPTDTDTAEYPLVQAGPYGRWFHSEFSDFVSMLVAQCQHAVLFDGYLMNTLISLLTELSDSYVRAFRHTCTLAAVKLLSALVSVALSHDVGINNSQKLYNVQKTKTARQKHTQQLERLKKKVTELQEKRAEVESMMDIIFKGVFLKRYLDVLPEIRCICVEEFGLWMKLYSSAFLNDSYLKYMGWMMHDKIPDVRIKSVLAMQSLYGDPLHLPKLDLFTNRFKERMISMTLDKDSEVAVQAMKLLLIISRTSEDVFTAEDYKVLLRCVYSSQRPLAALAGELLFSRFINVAVPATDSQEGLNEEEVHKLQSFAKLKALLQFFQESELHKHVEYLVDSLWDSGAALLKDWPMFTAALLLDASSERPGFMRAEQTVIVELLVASMRQASEGSVLVGRSGGKKIITIRDKKTQTDDCLKFTEHYLTVLPTLLSKFSKSSDIVASLLKIPQFFVPQCPQAGNAEVLSSLMAKVEAVLEHHSGSAVLETAARTYVSLCEDETPWCSTARCSRRSLVQRWVERLKAQLNVALTSDGFSANEETKGQILKNLKKLRTFYNCHDLSHLNLFDVLFPLLSVESDQNTTPPEVLLEVLQCLGFSILWDLNNSQNTLSCKEKAAALRLRLRLFCERSHRCLAHTEQGVRNQAFLGVCDVLTAHSYQLQVWNTSNFSLLLYTPSPRLQRALLNFLHVHVFVAQEFDSQAKVKEGSDVERMEDLHKRRNMLAAYCKLIVHGVMEMSLASEVFMYYVTYYYDFGDIIKEMMCQTRQMDKIENARTIDLCLQQLFVRLKREQDGDAGRSHLGVQTFSCIKELCRRFAFTFTDAAKFRECVVLIHRNGIEFVFQEFSQTSEGTTPPYLSYLIILSQFSSKLLKPDKKTVLAFLVKHTAEYVINMREESWHPLVYYRASLLATAEGDDTGSYVSSVQRNNLPGCSLSAIHKLEDGKPFSPANSKASKGPRASFSPSHQEPTPETEAFSDPPAKRPTSESIGSISIEAKDDTVEVEV